MAKRDQEEEELSPEAQAEEGAVMENRRAFAGAQAGREAEAKDVLAEALLRESGGGEEQARQEDARELEKEKERLREEVRILVSTIRETRSHSLVRPEWVSQQLQKILPRLEAIRDEKFLTDIVTFLLWVPGDEALNFVMEHTDQIPEVYRSELCERIIRALTMSDVESAEYFFERVFPELTPKEQGDIIRRVQNVRGLDSVYRQNKLLKDIFHALKLDQRDKDFFVLSVAMNGYAAPDLSFLRTHLGEVSAATRADIIDHLQRRGYSLVEGEPVEKVDSSLRLMEEGMRGFLLADWRERNREKYTAFDLADAATLQQVLEDAAQRKFEKPLAQLGSGEMKELLSNATAKEIDRELLPKIEAKMEPSTFYLILKKMTGSFDRANRCVEALAQKFYEKKLEDLSGDEFRELLGKETDLLEWITNDRFEQFTRGVYEEVDRREAEQDIIYAKAVNHAQGAKEIQIQQIVSDFDAALEAMPTVAASVQESLTNAREEMVQKIRDRYDEYFRGLGDHHQKAKEWLRSRVKAWLDQAAADIKSKDADVHYKREPEWKDQLDYGRDEGVSYLSRGQYFSEHEFVSTIIFQNNRRNLLEMEDELQSLGDVQKEVAAGTL